MITTEIRTGAPYSPCEASCSGRGLTTLPVCGHSRRKSVAARCASTLEKPQQPRKLAEDWRDKAKPIKKGKGRELPSLPLFG